MSNGKKLVRKTDDKIIAGVAAGLADYLNMDVTLVRLLFALTTIFGGFGLVAYIVMWIIVPEEGSDRAVIDDMVDSGSDQTPPEPPEEG
jgi:phage shock protein PspC (stress-responsive transcriptional regulator)